MAYKETKLFIQSFELAERTLEKSNACPPQSREQCRAHDVYRRALKRYNRRAHALLALLHEDFKRKTTAF